jgi:hypothetical protein
LIAHASLLDAVAQPEAAPAVLVGTINNYNVVRYDGRYFGVLQGHPIVWGAPGYDRDPQIVIGLTYAEVRAHLK